MFYQGKFGNMRMLIRRFSLPRQGSLRRLALAPHTRNYHTARGCLFFRFFTYTNFTILIVRVLRDFK